MRKHEKPQLFVWEGRWHCVGGATWEAHAAGCAIADRLNANR